MNERRTRQKFTKAFKEDATKLVCEQGYSSSEAGRRLGVLASIHLTSPVGFENPAVTRKTPLKAVSPDKNWSRKIADYAKKINAWRWNVKS